MKKGIRKNYSTAVEKPKLQLSIHLPGIMTEKILVRASLICVVKLLKR